MSNATNPIATDFTRGFRPTGRAVQPLSSVEVAALVKTYREAEARGDGKAQLEAEDTLAKAGWFLPVSEAGEGTYTPARVAEDARTWTITKVDPKEEAAPDEDPRIVGYEDSYAPTDGDVQGALGAAPSQGQQATDAKDDERAAPPVQKKRHPRCAECVHSAIQHALDGTCTVKSCGCLQYVARVRVTKAEGLPRWRVEAGGTFMGYVSAPDQERAQLAAVERYPEADTEVLTVQPVRAKKPKAPKAPCAHGDACTAPCAHDDNCRDEPHIHFVCNDCSYTWIEYDYTTLHADGQTENKARSEVLVDDTSPSAPSLSSPVAEALSPPTPRALSRTSAMPDGDPVYLGNCNFCKRIGVQVVTRDNGAAFVMACLECASLPPSSPQPRPTRDLMDEAEADLTAQAQERDRAERRKGIGSSDIAAIVGLNPHRTAMDVWLDKTGLAEPQEETPAMRAGTKLEAAIAEWYAEEEGVKIDGDGKTLFVHPDAPWARCHPDRRVHVSPGDMEGLEIKTASLWRKDEYGDGPDEVPETNLLQCCWCNGICLATGHVTRRSWRLAALIGGQAMKKYVLPFDEELFAMLFEAGRRFWFYNVKANVPPPLDGSEGTRKYLKARFPRHGDNCKIAPSGFEALVEAYEKAGRVEKQAKAEKEKAAHEIEAMIGEDMGVTTGALTATWLRVEETRIEAYTRAAYRSLRIKRTGGRS